MNRKNSLKSIFSISIFSCLVCVFSASLNTAHADVVNNSQWLVKSGDSVYGIARKMYPNNAQLRAKFRKELITANPDTFSNGAGQMSVGITLALPAFAIKKVIPEKKAPAVVVAPKIITPVAVEKKAEKTITEKTVAEAEMVTPDPVDIIGKVVINIGGLEAENRGDTRKLKRNSKIYRGDTIKTPNRTHTQIRMKDGALLSIRQNTVLRFSEYNFNGSEDGTERSLLELIKGGFRTITGAIGHRNKRNYSVRTSVATIGIRGTHYGLMLCDAGSCNDEKGLKDGLHGGVVDGEITTSNESGEHHFNNDEYFHIASSQQQPTIHLVPPPIFHGNADKQKLKQFAKNTQQKTFATR